MAVAVEGVSLCKGYNGNHRYSSSASRSWTIFCVSLNEKAKQKKKEKEEVWIFIVTEKRWCLWAKSNGVTKTVIFINNDGIDIKFCTFFFHFFTVFFFHKGNSFTKLIYFVKIACLTMTTQWHRRRPRFSQSFYFFFFPLICFFLLIIL